MKTHKIIKVLKFVQDYCEARDCDNCKFSSYNNCCLSDGNGNLPTYWDIKKIIENLIDTERIKINE